MSNITTKTELETNQNTLASAANGTTANATANVSAGASGSKMSVVEAHKMLTSGQVSSVELTQECLKIAKKNAQNSFITVTEDLAIEAAKKADESIAKSKKNATTPSILTGIPMAIKDAFCTKGVLTTSASKTLSNFTPTFNANVVQNLFNEGAVMIGKTNMDEFAMGSTNTNSNYGSCYSTLRDKRMPDAKLTPSGSSGGSAVSVLEGSSLFSLGSDTGGSVRMPASFCGIVGMKSSYGICSRYGLISYASSLDTCGAFANTVEDVGYVLNTMSGFDPKSSTSIAEKYDVKKFDHFNETINKGVKGLKIGAPKEYITDNISAGAKDAFAKSLKILSDNGAEIVDISLPHTDEAILVYYVVSTAEASSNLSRYDGVRYGVRSQDAFSNIDEFYANNRDYSFGFEVKRRIMLGSFMLASEHYEDFFVKATKIRALIKQDFDLGFEKVDAILCPSATNVAFDPNQPQDPIKIYLNDILTVPSSLAGLPAISVPVFHGPQSGLPIGMQVIAPHGKDNISIQVAKVLQDHS